MKQTAIDLLMRFGPKLLVALLILGVGSLVARWVGRGTASGLQHFELEPPVRLLLVRIARVLVVALFGILALQNLGVELLPLIAGLGVAGAGLALAMQGVLSNVVAGLSIIFTKPFRVGEYISVVGEEGTVDTITLFTTVLSHSDRSCVVIPNRKIVGEILHNYGRIRQLDVVVSVAYEVDLNKALTVVQDVVRSNERVLKNIEPVIGVVRLADFSVKIAVKPWVQMSDFILATPEVNKSILEQFRTHRIIIPMPQQDVRLVSAG